MHTWHWHTWEGLPYLTCSLLDQFSHGFFTQQFWPRLPHDLTPVLHPEATTHRVKQVHGNTVLPTRVVRETPPSETTPLPEADGIHTEQSAEAVWVCSADCTPALIADLKTGQVAAVHSGWRGTAAKIVPQAIARLQAQGSQLEDLRIALGPAIAGSVYQVGPEVAAAVGSTIVPEANPADLDLNTLLNWPHSPIHPDPDPSKVRLDVRQAIALQLDNLGIAPEQIAIAPHCTYQQPEHFFSYRRDQRKQVQWSGIVSLS